jgi:hypothetical protein
MERRIEDRMEEGRQNEMKKKTIDINVAKQCLK